MMNSNADALIFLKLGGSLITDKNRPHTPKKDTIIMLMGQIEKFRQMNPHTRIILGHGSGSFGHVPAHQYKTREGVHTPQEWIGFTKVWAEARALNTILMAICEQLPSLAALSFPVSAAAITQDGIISSWDTSPIQHALDHGLMPVVFGDVVFDTARGGSILSTEEIFTFLAKQLRPQRILIAGIETGVYQNYPDPTTLFQKITPATLSDGTAHIRGSLSTDVTGGMAEKVRLLLALCTEMPHLYGQIFSGTQPDAILRVLNGETLGTTICQDSTRAWGKSE